MAVDISEDSWSLSFPSVVSAKIGDCTTEAVLKSLGIGNFDICFIVSEIISRTVWRGYQSGLREIVKHVVSKGEPQYSRQVAAKERG